MINKNHNKISIRRQSALLSINRSTIYKTNETRVKDSELCNLIANIYSDYPIYGYRRITAMLNRRGLVVNRKKVQRLMKIMNLRAIYPGPNTSKRALAHKIYPYLLSNIEVSAVNQAWQIDITYLRTQNGFMYLVAIIDMYSRVVLSWNLSNDLSTDSCIKALDDAIIAYGKPDIINSDQGCQFTSDQWINRLQQDDIRVSMTGKGRSNDNANIERLWRSFKYEGSYLYKWNSVMDLKNNIPKWIHWYNYERPHQSLLYKTPIEKYYEFMDKSKDLPTISQYQPHNLSNDFMVGE